jgi:adenosine kinase
MTQTTQCRVFVTGTLGHDVIMNFPGRFADRINPDKLGSISLSFLVDRLTRHFGGTAGNIAYTMKLLGTDATILAPAGNDFGPYRDFLVQSGIDTSGITVHDDEPTSTYFVVSDSERNQIGSFYIGASKYAGQSAIPEDGQPFVVLAPTVPEAMVSYVRTCVSRNLRYVYDPAFQTGTFSREELLEGIAGAEIVVGNDYEVALMTERLEFTHEEMLARTKMLVTTLGDRGSRIESEGKTWEIPVCPIDAPADPTGAGDAYLGGFLAGHLRGESPDVSGRMGSVAAAYVVERAGTLGHGYTQQEFSDRYEKTYHDRIGFAVKEVA